MPSACVRIRTNSSCTTTCKSVQEEELGNGVDRKVRAVFTFCSVAAAQQNAAFFKQPIGEKRHLAQVRELKANVWPKRRPQHQS